MLKEYQNLPWPEGRPRREGWLDVETGESHWYRIDSKGRRVEIREHANDMGGSPSLADIFVPPDRRWHRRTPHPVYTYGYERAVAYEYELLCGELCGFSWRRTAIEMGEGLVVPTGEYGPYDGMVARYKAVQDFVGSRRPGLIEFILPVAKQHGLDAMPWGIGWLLSSVCEVAASTEPWNGGGDRQGPPHGKHDPQRDALLAYMYLSGSLHDAKARDIVRPVFDMTLIVDPESQAKTILRKLGARRGKGRPSGRYARDAEAKASVYTLLQRQVMYLTGYNL